MMIIGNHEASLDHNWWRNSRKLGTYLKMILFIATNGTCPLGKRRYVLIIRITGDMHLRLLDILF